jgi:hypothetical protein
MFYLSVFSHVINSLNSILICCGEYICNAIIGSFVERECEVEYSLVCVCQFHDPWWHGQPSQQLASLYMVSNICV